MVGAVVGGLAVGLPVEVLGLEEQHRVVAADGRPQQAGGVGGVRRIGDAQPRAVREDALARLAVVERAAAQVAADGRADHQRARERVVRPVPQHGQLVADLHHRRPDVVEELDLDHRLQPADGHAHRPADDVGLGQRRVEHALAPEGALQPQGGLEHAALALHLGQRLGAAAVGHVFAEHEDARVAGHLVREGAVDGRHHRDRRVFGRAGDVEAVVRRIDVGRVHVAQHRRRVGRGGGEGAVGRRLNLVVDAARDLRQRVVVGEPAVGQPRGEPGDGVAGPLGLAFRRALVVAVVVRFGMRVQPHHPGLDEDRPAPAARVGEGPPQGLDAGQRVGAVDADDLQPRERRHEAGDVAARGLELDGDGDGVAVVLDQVEHGEPAGAGGVQRFPELALAGAPVAERHVDDVALGARAGGVGDLREPEVVLAGFGAADGVEALSRDGAGGRHQVQVGPAPVRRHLAPARGRVVGRAHRGQQHLAGRHAQGQDQRPVAVVGEEPVAAGGQQRPRRDLDRFVARPADLEEALALLLELQLLVVEAPCQQHRAVEPQQIVGRQPPVQPLRGCGRRVLGARRALHGAACRRWDRRRLARIAGRL